MEVPLVTTLPPPSTLPANRQANQQLIFDFTKRKKWADLLVTELTEVVMLVLSDDGTVLYSGPAVQSLLGWADEELIDMNFCDIMNDEDVSVFKRQFAESIRAGTDLLSYARLRCKSEQDFYGPSMPVIPAIPPQPSADGNIPQLQSTRPPAKEVFFEIKGYPHFGADSAPNLFNASDVHAMANMEPQAGPSNKVSPSASNVFKCFFAMAKPYPSRNTAMLNTFLELKMENERLQQRLRDAKAKAEALDRAQAQRRVWSSHPFPQQMPYASQTETHSSGAPSFQSFAWTQNSAVSGPSRSFDSRQFYPRLTDSTVIGGSSTHTTGSLNSANTERAELADPSADHTLPRKKSKKSLTQEQYCCMTCGRTDSPEWRKGPQGPKTLCNACGLRWAKSVRTNPSLATEGDPPTEA
ncbi:uncharacterized protein PHACADRAFT_208823 [Phanerochaete carnosa HHB-10118-sp]|uniref:GATA-type domain-containing protein n=1 Tax=Phanerochaete carnosa (strain HHB-10118-sp) TaxID=650164 RepID=K5UYU9_PHACS|nr:uncharacterized protein PHACADRAFT_208823 [Phanerochaete carnosa HHB-10118-sp]EKM55306.1 hypothetical protein PHACADRAFT_208823 [Phanerochaete carnosa HHB-10118-sp]